MTSVSALDDQTAAAIRHALSAARTGKLAEACSIGERALAAGGEASALHAMLGMFHAQAGKLEQAVAHLESAREMRPADVRIATNLADALTALKRYDEALAVATLDAAAADPGLHLMKLRGFLAQTLEQFDLAVTAYEAVITRDSQDWESWNNLGNARRSAGDLEGSIEALRRATALNSSSAPVWLNLGTALVAAGEFGAAEELFQRMAADFPADGKPLRELHLLFKLEAREEEALHAIEAAVAREPDELELRLALASHSLSMLKHADAEAAYAEVARKDPSNSFGNLGLAVVYDLTNRIQDLSDLIGAAERRGVEDDALNFIRAFDHRRHKRYDQGLEALSKVPAELESARRAHLLGQLEEGAGHYSAAFQAFERMNEIQRADVSEPELRASAYRSNIRRQADTMTPEWAASWNAAVADDRSAPAFLVGFPRSGTTLLDTFLMGHPATQVLEEEPMLRQAQETIGGFDALPRASEDAVRAARNKYFEVAEATVATKPGTLLIDKNPLAMNGVPLIKRLFPGARIVLALRHPCDVVFSCFATNFKLNDGMANFLQLRTAVELYDLSFSHFERAQQLFGLPFHTIMYEKLVANPLGELKSLLAFLGLEWDERVLDHEATAQARTHIKTASYAQVVEPLYQRSAGRWRNYRDELEPFFPTLRPWIEKFGYDL